MWSFGDTAVVPRVHAVSGGLYYRLKAGVLVRGGGMCCKHRGVQILRATPEYRTFSVVAAGSATSNLADVVFTRGCM